MKKKTVIILISALLVISAIVCFVTYKERNITKPLVSTITIGQNPLSEEDQSEFIQLYNSASKKKLDKNAGEHGVQNSLIVKYSNGDELWISIQECCDFEARYYQKGKEGYKRFSISDEELKNFLKELANKY